MVRIAAQISLRQVVEHRLARLVQLGIRQARYFGRAKTLFQLYLAAAVANLTLLARKGIAPIVAFLPLLAVLRRFSSGPQARSGRLRTVNPLPTHHTFRLPQRPSHIPICRPSF